MFFASALNGISVTYDSDEGPITRDHFPFELFKTDSDIEVDVCSVLRFTIALPDRPGETKNFDRLKAKFIEGVRDDIQDLESLELNRRQEQVTKQLICSGTSLAKATGPAYVRTGFLALGSCGLVDYVRDVTDGTIRVRKTFDEGTEAGLKESLKGSLAIKHVSLETFPHMRSINIWPGSPGQMRLGDG